MYNIQELRQIEFPISRNYIYFNHASISPLPSRTKAKMQWVIEAFAGHPSRFWMMYGRGVVETFSQTLAAYINAASSQEITPISSTSVGLNAAAQAIEWQPGDNVVFCEIEFPSNAYPWLSLARDGVEVRQATAVDGGLTIESLAQKVDGHTRLVAVSSVQFFSGHRTDLAAIGQFCRQRGILFVVDAIQSIGHIPIDVQAMHIDVLASGGQKSILAAPGSGFMYVRQETAETMKPRIVCSNSTVDYLHWLAYDLTFLPGAQRFGFGTPNLAGMYAILESVQLIQELGVENIDRHTRWLSTLAMKLLTEMGYRVITPAHAHSAIVTFESGMSNEETDRLVAALDERNVAVVKHLDAAGKPHVRLSFHCYNTEEEVAQFGEILSEVNKIKA